MNSNKISINNQGHGFADAIQETKKAAEYCGLDAKNSVRLQLITEEMLSLASSITGETEATFWLEEKDGRFDLHMDTRTHMDKDKRDMLMAVSTDHTNEAKHSFLGFLRDKISTAFLAETDYSDPNRPMADNEVLSFTGGGMDSLYENSVLRRLADRVTVSIRGKSVEMTVTRTFGA